MDKDALAIGCGEYWSCKYPEMVTLNKPYRCRGGNASYMSSCSVEEENRAMGVLWGYDRRTASLPWKTTSPTPLMDMVRFVMASFKVRSFAYPPAITIWECNT